MLSDPAVSVPKGRQLSPAQWTVLERDPDFQELLAKKLRFIIPATVFFIVYYFSLPVLVGYFPEFMSQKVIGNINLAYLFALSQFIMTWVLTYVYAQQAKTWDEQARRITDKVTGGGPR